MAQGANFINNQGQNTNYTDSSQGADFSYEDVLNKDILELMGAGQLPEDKKIELYQKMVATIQNRVVARITDEIPEADMEEWLKTIDSGDKAKMQEFLKTLSIDLPKLMLEEAIIYKTELTDLSKQVK